MTNYTRGRKYQNIGLLCKDIVAGKSVFFGKRIVPSGWAINMPLIVLNWKVCKCYRAKKKEGYLK